MTEQEWLERVQRDHNLRSFRRPLPPIVGEYVFTEKQLEIALRSLEKQEASR